MLKRTKTIKDGKNVTIDNIWDDKRWVKNEP